MKFICAASAAALVSKFILLTILLIGLVGAQEKVDEHKTPLQYVLSKYLNNDELQEHMFDFTRRCKDISRLASVGKSTKGREIYVLEISDAPGSKEPEPNIKFVGNLHGNEPTGRVLTLALAEWLCANHKTDATASQIVKQSHIWLMPTANPDGFGVHKRNNLNDVDLNRDFPDRFNDSMMRTRGNEQQETKVIMQWTLDVGFTASAAFHEGALVANYPWDGTPDQSTRYMKCPDDAAFLHLAKTYAQNHRKMSLPTNAEFPNGGTTNGANWYPVYGSMQDWNYIKGKCLEVTLEVSERKWPAQETLAELWEDNKNALLKFIQAAAFGGLHGTVSVESKTLRAEKGREVQPAKAEIRVFGNNHTIFSSASHGAFFRPLAPGKYKVTAALEGYTPDTAEIEISADGSGARHDFILTNPVNVVKEGQVITAAGKTEGGSGAVQIGHKVALTKEAVVEDTTGRDALVLLGLGFGLFWCLWLVHKRVVRRSYAPLQRSLSERSR